MKKIHYLLLSLILGLSLFLRVYDLNWDQGFHLHPDERAIVLYVLPLHMPSSINEFFSVNSPLNPHFFAYGSFPIYLLKFVSSIAGYFYPSFAAYQDMNLLGRGISAVFDTFTVLFIFLLGKKLFSKNAGLTGAFLYGLSVLAIQTSHFYVVDTQLTFFTLFTLFALIRLYEKPSFPKAFLVGILIGISLATKTSALALGAGIFFALSADFLLIFFKSPHKIENWFPHVPHVVKKIFFEGIVIFLSGFLTFLLFEPYALIDFNNFWLQSLQQSAMTHNAFTFPYTLQYVGKIPWFYEIKNIFLWGQGPFIAATCFIGIIFVLFKSLRKEKKSSWAQELILLAFLFAYFAVVGHFSIGFMRYMLPIYPLLCLFGGEFSVWLFNRLPKNLVFKTIYFILFAISLSLWPISFMHIYSQPDTRVLATNWTLQNIPIRSTLAIEHWDDGLPLVGQSNYNMQTLPFYDPESPQKWQNIDNMLSQTDFIIIASNRLYVPLQKLTNCNKLPPFYCYPQTANYYQNLFSGKNVILNSFTDLSGITTPLNSPQKSAKFEKAAEFAIYPEIPFLNIPIEDLGADESFTVYDHPKVMIFKKELF